MSRFPMKEWQCAHCELDIFGEVGNPKFTCNLKHNFLRDLDMLQRGCFGDECIHNGKLKKYKYMRCPLAKNNGVCSCYDEKEGSHFCKFGEKANFVSFNCEIFMLRYDPIGCTMGKKMTREEMLIVFNNWIVNNRLGINGKKAFFADWFKKALKYIGAPVELIEYPTSICETNMSYTEIHEIYKKVLPIWKKFYTKEMKKIKKENEVQK